MNSDKTYIIEYLVFSNQCVPETRKTKVKRCMSELHAKIKLGEHLKGVRFEIQQCREDTVANLFGDLFGANNPFNFNDLIK